MDKKADWAWLPAAMPGVARLIADRRKRQGAAHVNECWRQGVLLMEPGWFFAWEGALAVGTPWGADDRGMAMLFGLQADAPADRPLLLMRDPEGWTDERKD